MSWPIETKCLIYVNAQVYGHYRSACLEESFLEGEGYPESIKIFEDLRATLSWTEWSHSHFAKPLPVSSLEWSRYKNVKSPRHAGLWGLTPELGLLNSTNRDKMKENIWSLKFKNIMRNLNHLKNILSLIIKYVVLNTLFLATYANFCSFPSSIIVRFFQIWWISCKTSVDDNFHSNFFKEKH